MNKVEKLSDKDLLLLLKDRNEAAFTEIYNRYWDILLKHGKKMLQGDDEVYDVLQEVFTVIWSKGPDLYITTSLSGYLYTLMRNRILNKISHSKIQDHYLSSLSDFSQNSLANTDYELREKQLTEFIDQQISILPHKMRDIFILSRKRHLSHKEIAEKLQISEHTVKKQINNALNIFRTSFKYFFLMFFALLFSCF